MKDKKLNILIIPTWYPSDMDPNGVPFIRAQAQALVKKGHSVTVVFTQAYSVKTILKQRKLMFGKRDNIVNGVREILTYFPKTHIKGIDEITRLIQGKKVLKNLVEVGYKPQILHVHTYLAGRLALWFHKKYFTPIVTTEHYTGFARGMVNTNRLKQARDLYFNSSINLGVSGAFSSLLTEKTGADFNTLPNMVDCDKFKPTLKDKRSEYTYLFVGSLHDKKNPLMLLNSFISLYKRDRSLRLILAGEGELSRELKNIVSNNRLDDIVSFPGFLKGDEVAALMSVSDCFILPSRFETFGIVVIEAMASGLPVIVTRSGGPESFVKDGENGIIIDQNQDQLKTAMLRVKKRSWDSKLIRQYVVDNFSEDAVIKLLEKIYTNIIQNGDVIQASRELTLSGGISKVANQLGQQLTKREFNVTTFTTEYDNTSSCVGRVMVLPVPKWFNKLPAYFKNYVKTLWFVKQVDKIYKHKNTNPNCVTISHRDSYGADIAVGHSCHKEAISIKKREGRSLWWLNPIHALYIKEESLIFKKPFPILAAISTSIAREYKKHYNIPSKNIETIPNGVDLNRFHPSLRIESRAQLIKEFSLPDNAFILLFVGNEFKRKGLDYILDALEILKDQKELHLFILGGADKTSYLKRVEGTDLLERIYFTGIRSDTQLFFTGSDIFILPANYEPFGLVGIEALSSGTPILAPELGGFLDYLKDGKNGYFIKRDGADIAQKIMKLIDRNVWSKMSSFSRKSVLEFSWDNIGNMYAKLVKNVYLKRQNEEFNG